MITNLLTSVFVAYAVYLITFTDVSNGTESGDLCSNLNDTTCCTSNLECMRTNCTTSEGNISVCVNSTTKETTCNVTGTLDTDNPFCKGSVDPCSVNSSDSNACCGNTNCSFYNCTAIPETVCQLNSTTKPTLCNETEMSQCVSGSTTPSVITESTTASQTTATPTPATSSSAPESKCKGAQDQEACCKLSPECMFVSCKGEEHRGCHDKENVTSVCPDGYDPLCENSGK
ncbi:hypothetical protein SNE40_019670 [Patella caerulea]|uniref:Uncharacterized protein n=1 Tax=Patella caerulea TaxID=87958 RepID=A0AAN8P6C1_PATCE